ncbi:hypothetical protein HPB51_010586 [Rhipicephalus microplus]|uniref:Uncharacterized protein n=1 Tax=Rhipicephalus microplus TaxID=6941 RepID=A0A9J6E8R9_RHIMP|nr:hypothetical protein HPB51_010586 [Rhipicephalus microplus]
MFCAPLQNGLQDVQRQVFGILRAERRRSPGEMEARDSSEGPSASAGRPRLRKAFRARTRVQGMDSLLRRTRPDERATTGDVGEGRRAHQVPRLCGARLQNPKQEKAGSKITKEQEETGSENTFYRVEEKRSAIYCKTLA